MGWLDMAMVNEDVGDAKVAIATIACSKTISDKRDTIRTIISKSTD